MKRLVVMSVALALAGRVQAQAAPAPTPAPAPAAEPVPAAAAASAPDGPAPSSAPTAVVIVPAPGVPVVAPAPRPLVRPPHVPRSRRRPRGPVRTFGGRVALQAGGVLAWSDDAGYDRFFERGLQRGFDLGASYDVLRPAPDLALSLGASVRASRGKSSEGQLSLHGLVGTVDLAVRYAALPVLPVFARVGLGMARARVELDPDDMALSERDGTDRAFAAELGAGVVLCTAAGWFEALNGRFAHLSFGLSAEGGYRFGSALAPGFAGGSELGVAQRYASLGKLDVKAPYLRLLGTLRF